MIAKVESGNLFILRNRQWMPARCVFSHDEQQRRLCNNTCHFFDDQITTVEDGTHWLQLCMRSVVYRDPTVNDLPVLNQSGGGSNADFTY
jgi:hypothetical protein